MIEFTDVSFTYGDRTTLSGVSVRLEPGGFYFLTGPSGAGKSTFLKLCYLALTPTAGTVELFGRKRHCRVEINRGRLDREVYGLPIEVIAAVQSHRGAVVLERQVLEKRFLTCKKNAAPNLLEPARFPDKRRSQFNPYTLEITPAMIEGCTGIPR